MDNNVKVSVLMSIYNESIDQIKESVESMISQTFQDYECIIILDNPDRDDIDALINGYKDPRFRLYKNDSNIGLAMSMNKAASLSKAGILARMDADDIAEEEKLEICYNVITTNKADVVFSNYHFIDGNSVIIDDRYKIEYKEGYVASKEIALSPNQIHHPTVMMRRSIFEAVGGYRNFPCAQDSDLWLRMQEHGAVFYSIMKPLLRYRVNPQGTTQKKLFKQQLTTHYIYSLSIERMQTGKDSYSIENYNDYLKRGGLYSTIQNNLFRFGWWSLNEAKHSALPIQILLRISVFLLVPQLRNYYLMSKKKNRLLSKLGNNEK